MLPFSNQIQLVGRAGHEPEILQVSDGTQRSTLRLYQNKRSTGTHEDPQIHHLVAWSGVALQLHERVKRGDRLLIQGKLLYRKFECKGLTQLHSEIHVDHFAVLDVGAFPKVAAVAEQPREWYGQHE